MYEWLSKKSHQTWYYLLVLIPPLLDAALQVVAKTAPFGTDRKELALNIISNDLYVMVFGYLYKFIFYASGVFGVLLLLLGIFRLFQRRISEAECYLSVGLITVLVVISTSVLYFSLNT